MPFEGLFASLGLGGLAAGDLFVTQVSVLAATGFLFLSSLVLSVMAFRSAAAAHRSLREARDLASEMRHLTAQVEFSSRRPAAAPEARDGGDYADESIDLTEEDRAEFAHQEQQLEAAKRAAIEPSALLRGRLRRR